MFKPIIRLLYVDGMLHFSFTISKLWSKLLRYHHFLDGQISGHGCKENKLFCISKPSFRFVRWVGCKHFKAKSSKPCWACWLLLRAWTMLAGIWILQKHFSPWLPSSEGWTQQAIVLEQPCQDCAWIGKGIRVSGAGFSPPLFLELTGYGNHMNFSGTYMRLVHPLWSTRISSHPTFYWMVSWTPTSLILGLQAFFQTRNSRYF